MSGQGIGMWNVVITTMSSGNPNPQTSASAASGLKAAQPNLETIQHRVNAVLDPDRV